MITELPDDYDVSKETVTVLRSDGTTVLRTAATAEALAASKKPATAKATHDKTSFGEPATPATPATPAKSAELSLATDKHAEMNATAKEQRAPAITVLEPAAQTPSAATSAAVAASAEPPQTLPTPALATTAETDRKRFAFLLLESAKFPGFNNKDTQDMLYKWGMQGHCYVKRFTYDQYLEPYNIDAFLVDVFNNNPHIKVQGKMDQWGTLGRVTAVHKEETKHTVTSLSFFDRLRDHGITRGDGEIRKCLDEYVDSFIVSDELRKCLLMPEYESYDVFTPADRSEFIFHAFKAICLGGRLCQFEDRLDAYLDVTKRIYKDLITVAKDTATGKLKVASLVYKITGVESSVSPLFPLQHPQNFCYLSIDPVRRHVNIWYHASDEYY